MPLIQIEAVRRAANSLSGKGRGSGWVPVGRVIVGECREMFEQSSEQRGIIAAKRCPSGSCSWTMRDARIA